jgi:hypothetical protein
MPRWIFATKEDEFGSLAVKRDNTKETAPSIMGKRFSFFPPI